MEEYEAGSGLIRDENLRRIRQVGRKAWKQEVGYHRRSLAETQMYRVKTIFGGGSVRGSLPDKRRKCWCDVRH